MNYYLFFFNKLNLRMISLGEFYLIILLESRIIHLSSIPIFYYQNPTSFTVYLKDQSADAISFLTSDQQTELGSISISYSWAYLNSTQDVVFTELVSNVGALSSFNEYPSVRYRSLKWSFPWISESNQPIILVIVQHFI